MADVDCSRISLTLGRGSYLWNMGECLEVFLFVRFLVDSVFRYWCPLPTWEAREYHVVIRSGPNGLGQWLSEERDLFADYEHYIGPKDVPERIVRVWLISNDAFQRLDGDMTVQGIEIVGSEDRVTEVL